MFELVMPILGADMEAGTLVAWCKHEGDTVRRGDVVAEVETDKGLIEIEIFATGVLERILVAPGAKVPVGTVLALVRETEAGAEPATRAAMPSPPPEGGPPAPAAPASGVAAGAPAAAEAGAPAAGAARRIRASPAARALAAELGVDLARVRGSGAGGAITREDVADAAAAARPGAAPPAAAEARPGAAAPLAAPPAGAAVERHGHMRSAIAAAMARSKREIPHYYLATTIDLGPAMRWLERENAGRPVTERLLPVVVLLKAVALALREVPELNAVWTGTGAELREEVHLGVAITLRGGGLVVPALHHADQLRVPDLMRGFRDLVGRARAGTLRSSELSDSTITVTSLGDQGVETVFGIIYPPQVALVGFGRVVERPWVVGDRLVARPVVTATLAADHRVSDGHRGGLFLAAVARRLAAPEEL